LGFSFGSLKEKGVCYDTNKNLKVFIEEKKIKSMRIILIECFLSFERS